MDLNTYYTSNSIGRIIGVSHKIFAHKSDEAEAFISRYIQAIWVMDSFARDAIIQPEFNKNPDGTYNWEIFRTGAYSEGFYTYAARVMVATQNFMFLALEHSGILTPSKKHFIKYSDFKKYVDKNSVKDFSSEYFEAFGNELDLINFIYDKRNKIVEHWPEDKIRVNALMGGGPIVQDKLMYGYINRASWQKSARLQTGEINLLYKKVKGFGAKLNNISLEEKYAIIEFNYPSFNKTDRKRIDKIRELHSNDNVALVVSEAIVKSVDVYINKVFDYIEFKING